MIDSSYTSASNPNSMRNMGIPLKVEPVELVLENDMLIEEEDEKELVMDDAIDEELKKYLKEEEERKLNRHKERERERKLEKESNRSYRSEQI